MALLTYEVPGHLLVLLDAAHVRQLQQRVDVVGVNLQQGLGKNTSLVSTQSSNTGKYISHISYIKTWGYYRTPRVCSQIYKAG